MGAGRKGMGLNGGACVHDGLGGEGPNGRWYAGVMQLTVTTVNQSERSYSSDGGRSMKVNEGRREFWNMTMTAQEYLALSKTYWNRWIAEGRPFFDACAKCA